MSYPEDNSPEAYYIHLKTESAIAEIRSSSRRYGGRTSLIAGGIWFASGALITECLLGMNGNTEHMSVKEQVVAAAIGGLVAAGVVIRKGYASTGIHPYEVVQSREERQKGNRLNAEADYLRPWLEKDDNRMPVDESIIEKFKEDMETEL